MSDVRPRAHTLDGLSRRIRWKYFISLERADTTATAVASSSSVIRGEEVERRVGGNDVNEIANNLPRDEIFHHSLETFCRVSENGSISY